MVSVSPDVDREGLTAWRALEVSVETVARQLG